MEVEILPNPVILSSAREFYAASLVIGSSAPKIVILAFALELYLKCLNSTAVFKDGTTNVEGLTTYEAVVHKANAKGHKLSELFSELKPGIVKIVEDLYSEPGETFGEALAEFNNIFIEWRYSFEGNNKAVNVTKLARLLDILEQTVDNIGKNN